MTNVFSHGLKRTSSKVILRNFPCSGALCRVNISESKLDTCFFSHVFFADTPCKVCVDSDLTFEYILETEALKVQVDYFYVFVPSKLVF